MAAGKTPKPIPIDMGVGTDKRRDYGKVTKRERVYPGGDRPNTAGPDVTDPFAFIEQGHVVRTPARAKSLHSVPQRGSNAGKGVKDANRANNPDGK
jgi:hypothetical protein